MRYLLKNTLFDIVEKAMEPKSLAPGTPAGGVPPDATCTFWSIAFAIPVSERKSGLDLSNPCDLFSILHQEPCFYKYAEISSKKHL
jgi:hypothetical protein